MYGSKYVHVSLMIRQITLITINRTNAFSYKGGVDSWQQLMHRTVLVFAEIMIHKSVLIARRNSTQQTFAHL
jgi:hypothetical protein